MPYCLLDHLASQMTKIGRNNPCPCGSGRKFKRCHGSGEFTSAVTKTLAEEFGSFGTRPLEQAIANTPKKNVDEIVSQINEQRANNNRPLPSHLLISIGDIPNLATRHFLVDTCAALVDQNWCGRSEMCIYFAALMRHGLNQLRQKVVVELGKAKYSGGAQSFEWDHAWVKQTEDLYLIDGNIDALQENPFVADGITPLPFWGPVDQMPKDRIFKVERILPPDRDEIELDAEPIRMWKQDLEKKLEHFTMAK